MFPAILTGLAEALEPVPCPHGWLAHIFSLQNSLSDQLKIEDPIIPTNLMATGRIITENSLETNERRKMAAGFGFPYIHLSCNTYTRILKVLFIFSINFLPY